MGDADAAVPRITPEEAKAMMGGGNTLVVDVRETHEVVRSGKIAGAVHVPCSALEFRADPKRRTTTTILTRTKPSSFTARPAKGRR